MRNNSRTKIEIYRIDVALSSEILSDPNDASIAKTILTLAESMNLNVIAEGVEMDAQRIFLANAGCHAYQGFLFSRPLPLLAFEQHVKDSPNAVDEAALTI